MKQKERVEGAGSSLSAAKSWNPEETQGAEHPANEATPLAAKCVAPPNTKLRFQASGRS
jgi:hypothetical protein